VRGYEKAGRYSFFNKVYFNFTNDQKGPVHLRILQTKGKQRAYWGKCPSSYIVKKCPAYRNGRINLINFGMGSNFRYCQSNENNA
jgi:hypothetical protein